MSKFGHNRQREPLQRKGPQLRVIALWLTALLWIAGVAAYEGDLRIGLYGATIELLAAVVCIQLTWYIKRDHAKLSSDLTQTNIPRAHVQPVVDTVSVFYAGWIARDLKQQELDDDSQPEEGNVHYLADRCAADRRDRQLRVMRRPTAPVPPQRRDGDKSDTA